MSSTRAENREILSGFTFPSAEGNTEREVRLESLPHSAFIWGHL